MTPLATFFAARVAVQAAVALGALALGGQQASALDLGVKLACASDYYSYCSQHSPSSPGVRTCMRVNGSKLSNRCVNALISAGEVSSDEVVRKRAASQTASR
ncbi:MAG: hypothetical protein K2X41_07345 [Hyphomicrobium sp.]|nr:hypothetical protein [Hyphomicrobium sp.]